MSDHKPVRILGEVMRALSAASCAHPDQRVMQVIVNACGTDPFYLEDEEATRLLFDYSRKIR